jgi:hypothetical protein
MTIPDLSQIDLTSSGLAGVTVVVAVPFVVQVLKRAYPILKKWAPLLVIGMYLLLILTALFAPTVFLVLGATAVLSALGFGIHDHVQTQNKPPSGPVV